MSDIDPGRCPICREPNACGLQAGQPTCWCFDARIPATALARVPAEDTDRACICQACATAAADAPAAAGRPGDR
jgi:hypothetical protein